MTLITIDLGTIEYYDDVNNKFEYEHGGVVDFEYTLKAVYEWEAKWKKPFLKGKLTNDELLDFYSMMARTPIDKRFITSDIALQLANYISDSQTATVFSSTDQRQNGSKFPINKTKTAEELYAIMFLNNIPIEFENRNLNRLLTILRVIEHKNSPPKTMSKEEVLMQNRELNRQRRAQMKTKG